MSDTDEAAARLDTWRPLSWGAILYGAVIALAISTMLHVLGIGIAASSVDPGQRIENFFLTLGGVSGAWLIVATMIGLFIGGFVAANISRTFSDERAVLYGLGVWAVSAIVTISIAVWMTLAGAGATLSAAGTVAQTAAQGIGGLGQGLGALGGQAAQNALTGPVMQRIEQALTGGQRGQIDPQGAQQILRIVQSAAAQGRFTRQSEERLIAAVANTFNVPPEEARQRVQAAAAQINETIGMVQEGAREAAESALNALAITAYWAFAAILFGGIASLIGARYGSLDPEDLPRFVRARLGGAGDYSASRSP